MISALWESARKGDCKSTFDRIRLRLLSASEERRSGTIVLTWLSEERKFQADAHVRKEPVGVLKASVLVGQLRSWQSRRRKLKLLRLTRCSLGLATNCMCFVAQQQ